MEVQLESLKQLKNEALKLATKIEWTADSFDISPMDLDDIIIEISEKLNEDRRSERQNEAKTKKIADQISSRGPQISLPKLTSPVDILQWIRMYQKITNIVDSEISKLALIKESLVGSDRKSTAHMENIVDILGYIKQKYMKEVIILIFIF